MRIPKSYKLPKHQMETLQYDTSRDKPDMNKSLEWSN